MGRLDLPDKIRDEDIYPGQQWKPCPDFRICGHKFVLAATCTDCKEFVQARTSARLAANA